jgi:hypothetical protein
MTSWFSHLASAVLGVMIILPGAPIFCREAQAQLSSTAGWTVFSTPSGLNVPYPANIFSVGAGATEKGVGQKFRSADGRADFSAYSLANTDNDTPASYLRKNLLIPPRSLVYRRVTNRFFVMSSIREDRIFYSRCNFAISIHCIFLEYPMAEKAPWDGIVTRMSYSLRPQ